jgi:hypothetical protein
VSASTFGADFVADWTPSAPKGEATVTEPVCEVQCDSAYCHLGSAAAAVLKSPSGIKLRYALRLNCDNCTNNVAEYEGLLLTLRKARAVGARRLVILTDSELVACHIGKTYKAKKPDMMKYLQAVRGMEKFFIGITVKLPQKLQQGSRCYREGNRSARTLAPGCVLRNHNCEIRRRRHSAPQVCQRHIE